tara:strand:+ start:970 stop:1287 length:318 start_codon:yes stop_codon:yes gene_type:complete
MTTSATSATSLVNAINGVGSRSPAASVDYGLALNPHFNNPDKSSRDSLLSFYSKLVKDNGVTAETFHKHLKAKTLHLLLGKYFDEDELKNVLVDGRVKNVYESFP